MKIFHFYVLKSFLKYIIIVQLFVTIMSVFSSSMGDSRMLSNYDYTFIQFLTMQLYAIILNLNVAMPVTTTVATIIVILLMMRNHELLAYVSLGGTIISLAIPFVTVGVCIAAGMMASEYQVVPKVRESREELIGLIRDKDYSKPLPQYADMWLVDDGGDKLIKIDLVDMLGQVISGVEEYIISDNFQINQVVSIDNIKRMGDMWLVTGKRTTDISQNPPVVSNPTTEIVKNKLWDDLLRITVSDARALSPTQLSTLARVMKSRGMSVNKYELLLYGKFSNAFSVIVLLVLTFPIAINFSRNYSLIKNAALTFAMGLMFWLFQAMCYSLGETGTLAPIYANFLPFVIFICLSAAIVYRRNSV